MPTAEVTLPYKPTYKAVLSCAKEDFNLAQTLDCGQAFRWRQTEEGGFLGVAFQKICYISQLDNEIFFSTDSEETFQRIWKPYFDLDRDYAALKQQFSVDLVLSCAINHAPGIRLLQQEPWEALCSFIISQNNNVPRIKGIIERLCELLGEPLAPGIYGFPTPKTLAALTPEDLAPLRAGFRARYLIDAAQKVVSGVVVPEALRTLPIDEARAMLLQITGVGVKVAECVLLYGCNRLECVPIDVWIRRVLSQLYPNGLPACTKGAEGIAQQYLFHYARTCPQAVGID